MPVTSPQGTLDFKKVDKITFVGASSNTVIDTTTGSVGIGVVGDALRSNLHVVGDTRMEGNINMLHTSNTASIKLNSNVVTEFPRSKKLMKFPRVALTSAAQTESGYEGYIVTRSSQFLDYNAWEAFDENNPVGGDTGAGSGWASTIPGNYSVSTGAWGGGGTPHHTGSTEGEWIQIQLPDSIYLHDFVIESRSEITYGADGYDHGYPKDVVLYGSINGSSWDTIKTFTTGQKTFSEAHTENINETRAYKYFALVVNSTQVVNNTTQGTWTSIGQIRLFGVPEYDPEAYGTDVVVKSVPNVPNTDWLEVYYDAKNYTNGVVQDETANNRDGTLYGNASLNSTDGIHKFDFDGNGDYIKTTLTGFTGTTVTFSAWVFMDSIDTTRAQTIMGLGSWGGAGSAAWIAVGTSGVLETGNKSIESCASPVQANTLTGRWLHITGIVSSGDFRFYQDGQLIKSLTTTGTINYGTNPVLYIATRADSSGNPEATRHFDCKIANARLFNRALTTDEIYQLYAYQKEDFGHSTNRLTLKAGRLGIGTSEPRAALDVRGDMYGGCPVFFTAYAGNNGTVSGSTGGTVIIFNKTTVNKGGAYDTSNGRFTAPINGYYEVFFRGSTSSTNDFHLQMYRNGNAPSVWRDHLPRLWDASDKQYRNAGTIQFFDYFDAGEYLDVRMIGSGVFNADNYNSFSVKYLSN
tara:strand:- start:2128 stop:4203 length:2076 start_codon:yes stop_codon:yes gene_type:complete